MLSDCRRQQWSKYSDGRGQVQLWAVFFISVHLMSFKNKTDNNNLFVVSKSKDSS